MPYNGEGAEYHEYMERCIGLALRCDPKMHKPFIGAVVISPERDVIAEGTKRFVSATNLTLHAERVAIENAQSAGYDVENWTLVTTLEPCVRKKARRGKFQQIFTSCSELIVDSKISTVVIGLMDESATTRGGTGLDYLRRRGVEVIRYTGLNDRIREQLMARF